MNRTRSPRRFVPLLLPVLTAAALAGCAPAAGPTRNNSGTGAHPTPESPTERVVIVDCAGKPVERPSSITLTCADAGNVLADLRWTQWDRSGAAGSGVQQVNDCTPTCVAGKTTAVQAVVRLTGPTRVDGTDELAFTRVSVQNSSDTPAQTFDLPH